MQAKSGDILIQVDMAETSVWLKSLLENEINFVDSVLCKVNADNIYDLAVAFESFADRCRNQYELWKRNNFERGLG